MIFHILYWFIIYNFYFILFFVKKLLNQEIKIWNNKKRTILSWVKRNDKNKEKDGG